MISQNFTRKFTRNSKKDCSFLKFFEGVFASIRFGQALILSRKTNFLQTMTSSAFCHFG